MSLIIASVLIDVKSLNFCGYVVMWHTKVTLSKDQKWPWAHAKLSKLVDRS